MKTTVVQSRSVESYKLTVQLRGLIDRVKTLNEHYSKCGRRHPGYTRLFVSDFAALDKRIRQESDSKFGLRDCVLYGYPVITDKEPAPEFALEPEQAAA